MITTTLHLAKGHSLQPRLSPWQQMILLRNTITNDPYHIHPTKSRTSIKAPSPPSFPASSRQPRKHQVHSWYDTKPGQVLLRWCQDLLLGCLMLLNQLLTSCSWPTKDPSSTVCAERLVPTIHHVSPPCHDTTTPYTSDKLTSHALFHRSVPPTPSPPHNVSPPCDTTTPYTPDELTLHASFHCCVQTTPAPPNNLSLFAWMRSQDV
jgi:hypothetical protein